MDLIDIFTRTQFTTDNSPAATEKGSASLYLQITLSMRASGWAIRSRATAPKLLLAAITTSDFLVQGSPMASVNWSNLMGIVMRVNGVLDRNKAPVRRSCQMGPSMKETSIRGKGMVTGNVSGSTGAAMRANGAPVGSRAMESSAGPMAGCTLGAGTTAKCMAAVFSPGLMVGGMLVSITKDINTAKVISDLPMVANILETGKMGNSMDSDRSKMPTVASFIQAHGSWVQKSVRTLSKRPLTMTIFEVFTFD